MDERRRLARWQINTPAKISLKAKEEFSDCCIEDINLKGMCISLSEPLPQERPVKMTLALADYLDLELEVEVPWEKENLDRYVYGLCFSRVKDLDKERIYRFIHRHCPQQFKNQWGS
ncbi:MAG: PilZ domain-containing protein [Candidatus Omnitrophota bacterium]